MRIYDRQIIFHMGIPNNGTPKVKWDAQRNPAHNTNIDMTVPTDFGANVNAVAELTSNSRIYIVGHGVPPDTGLKEMESIYKTKREGIHFTKIVDYIGKNARHPSLRGNRQPLLRISMVVCYASHGPMPGKFHDLLFKAYGIYSEVLARPNIVVFNPGHGIKYARDEEGRALPGRAPKVMYYFNDSNKQITVPVYPDEVDHQDWNWEAVGVLNEQDPEGAEQRNKDNDGNVERYHLKVANKALFASLGSLSQRTPKSEENQAIHDQIDELLTRYGRLP